MRRDTIFDRILAWIKLHRVASAIIALVILFLLYAIFVPAQRDYTYLTKAANKGDIARIVSASGKLRALNTIKVGSEISGQVTDVYVDFNSPVTAGQVLARIDATRLNARVAQARAQVQLAKATLAQADAAITRARTDVEVQTREFERRTELVKKGFVSKAAIDQAQNALATAKAALSTAIAQAQGGRAQIAQSSAELSSAQLDLSRTTIIAPTSGIVIDKLVEPGTTVAASFQTPKLFEIAADTSRMQVEASVDEADIGQVKNNQKVRFTVDSYPDDTFDATVQQIRKAATEAQNVVSYLVILDVDNKAGKLLTGMTANVEIITGTKTDVLRVPTSAIRFRPRKEDRPENDGDQQDADDNGKKKRNEATVWVATDDEYEPVEKAVTIGLAGEEYVEIIKGLKPKERVLTRSKKIKKDGSSSSSRSDDDEDESGND